MAYNPIKHDCQAQSQAGGEGVGKGGGGVKTAPTVKQQQLCLQRPFEKLEASALVSRATADGPNMLDPAC